MHMVKNPSLLWSISTSGTRRPIVVVVHFNVGYTKARRCCGLVQRRVRLTLVFVGFSFNIGGVFTRRCLIVCQHRWWVHRRCSSKFQRRVFIRTVVEVVPLLTKFGLYHSNFKNKATLWLSVIRNKQILLTCCSHLQDSDNNKHCMCHSPWKLNYVPLLHYLLSKPICSIHYMLNDKDIIHD